MTVHVSLDLETWGTTPGSDIRSIGAVVFDPMAGVVYDGGSHQHGSTETFYIATDSPVIAHRPGMDSAIPIRKYPLTRNAQTVQWWSEQSDEAQAAFTDPVDLGDALMRFGEWLGNVGGFHYPSDGNFDGSSNPLHTLNIWSHGAAFDAPILAAAYAAVGLPVPWHYRAPRDTRTLFDAAGIDDHSAWLAAHPGPLGISHHSLDDSICQARAVCAAYQRIKVASSN